MILTKILAHLSAKHRVNVPAIKTRTQAIKRGIMASDGKCKSEIMLKIFNYALISGQLQIGGLLDLLILQDLLDISIWFCEELDFLNPFFENARANTIKVFFQDKRLRVGSPEYMNIKLKNSIDYIIKSLRRKVLELHFTPCFSPVVINYKRMQKKITSKTIVPLITPHEEQIKTVSSLYDIDGVSFGIAIEDLDKHLKTAIFVDLRNRGPISNSEYIWNGSFKRVKELRSVYIGSTHTDIGALNIYLVYGKKGLSLCELCTELKRVLNSSQRSGPLYNNMLMSIKTSDTTLKFNASPSTLKIVLESVVDKRMQPFIYVERYGQKNTTSSLCMYDILVKIHNSVDMKKLYWINFDICRTFYIPTEDLTCSTLNITNFFNFPTNIYKILHNEQIANANGRTWAVVKGKLRISAYGFTKVNFYTKIVDFFINEQITAKRVPPFTLSKILQNFYGLAFIPHRKSENFALKVSLILKSLEREFIPHIPIRLEGRTAGFNIVDFEEYSSVFINRAHIHTIPVLEVKELIKRTIYPLLRLINSEPRRLIDFYGLLLTEIYIKEFFITGSCNTHCLDKESRAIITLAGAAENIPRVICNSSSGTRLRVMRRLLKCEKRIGEYEIFVFDKIVSLINIPAEDVARIIVGEYLIELEKKATQAGVILNLPAYVYKFFGSPVSGMICCTMFDFIVEESNIGNVFLKQLIIDELSNKSEYILDVESNKLVKFWPLETFSRIENIKKLQLRIVKVGTKKRYSWTEEETLRAVHGLTKYAKESNKYSKLYNDFSYGFFYTRTNVNLKDLERNIITNNTRYNRINAILNEFELQSFTPTLHYKYMQESGLEIDENAKKIYEEILQYDLKENHGITLESTASIKIESVNTQTSDNVSLPLCNDESLKATSDAEEDLSFLNNPNLDFLSE